MLNRYESVYILSGALKADVLAKAWEKVKASVQKVGGKILEEQVDIRRTTVRSGKKDPAGHVMELAMELDPAKLHELNEMHRLDVNVLRAMIVKAPKKSSLAPAGAGIPGVSTNLPGEGEDHGVI